MNQEEITALAHAAGEAGAHEALRQTFRMLGVDIDDQNQVNEFRADLVHARRWRKLASAVGSKAVLAIATGLLALAGSLIWEGMKNGR